MKLLIPTKSLTFYFGMSMVLVYVFLGFLLIFNDAILTLLPRQYGKIMGVIILSYGLFRANRQFQLWKKNNEEE